MEREDGRVFSELGEKGVKCKGHTTRVRREPDRRKKKKKKREDKSACRGCVNNALLLAPLTCVCGKQPL